MAKFKAGDFITGELEFSEKEWIQDEYGDWVHVLHEWKELRVYLVNRVIIEENPYSGFKRQEFYSLDNGDGWIDSRSLCREIDAKFELCE